MSKKVVIIRFLIILSICLITPVMDSQAGETIHPIVKTDGQNIHWKQVYDNRSLRAITSSPTQLVAVGEGGMIRGSSDNGNTWTDRISGTNAYLGEIIYDNGIFVASGEKGTILTSPDGITWTKRTSGTDNYLWEIIYDNGIFVATGKKGTILTSPDGITWTKRTSGTDYSLEIIYGNGIFVATGEKGTILTSSDGITWTKRTSGTDNLFYGNGLFVAIGSKGTILTSPDCITWTKKESGINDIRTITAGKGKFVATNGDGTTVGVSTDGINWMINNTDIGDKPTIFYGNERFVAFSDEKLIGDVGDALTSKILYTSTDGLTWEAQGKKPFDSITFINNIFIAKGERNGSIFTSPDGINWTEEISKTHHYLSGFIFANGQYVAIGRGGTILTSPDGIDWIVKEQGNEVNDMQGIIFANGQFVAVGDEGTILTSPDGSTWSTSKAGTGEYLTAITYGNGQYVAVGYYNTAIILTSPDGITWTKRTSEINDFLSHISLSDITFAKGQFVAVGSEGTILTSPDGITWTKRTSGTNDHLFEIVYGNGIFVATGEKNTILSSTDGITWKKLKVDMGIAIAYGNGLFVGVNEDTILISKDGNNWAKGTLGTEFKLKNIISGIKSFLGKDKPKEEEKPTVSNIIFGHGQFIAFGSNGYENNDIILSSTDGITWTKLTSNISFIRDMAWSGNRLFAITAGGLILGSQ